MFGGTEGSPLLMVILSPQCTTTMGWSVECPGLS